VALGPHHACLAGRPVHSLGDPRVSTARVRRKPRGSQLIADPDGVAILTREYAMLRTQALDVEDTTCLLDRLLGER